MCRQTKVIRKKYHGDNSHEIKIVNSVEDTLADVWSQLDFASDSSERLDSQVAHGFVFDECATFNKHGRNREEIDETPLENSEKSTGYKASSEVRSSELMGLMLKTRLRIDIVTDADHQVYLVPWNSDRNFTRNPESIDTELSFMRNEPEFTRNLPAADTQSVFFSREADCYLWPREVCFIKRHSEDECQLNDQMRENTLLFVCFVLAASRVV